MQNEHDVVNEIARATNSNEDMVAQMYAQALERYRQNARVNDYVPLFAARRVREKLQERFGT
ncbi:hypothetical protein OKW49_008127 [Paraburkholderia youngii]|uniref:DUF3562 domain-containing protein n=1 Tax=Paraburkholderia youngii TaxID=2782701 RepID=UPI003D1A3A7C